jgi:hypothetical protein
MPFVFALKEREIAIKASIALCRTKVVAPQRFSGLHVGFAPRSVIYHSANLIPQKAQGIACSLKAYLILTAFRWHLYRFIPRWE